MTTDRKGVREKERVAKRGCRTWPYPCSVTQEPHTLQRGSAARAPEECVSVCDVENSTEQYCKPLWAAS